VNSDLHFNGLARRLVAVCAAAAGLAAAARCDAAAPTDATFTVRSFAIDGLAATDDPAPLLERLQRFTGEHVAVAGLDDAAAALESSLHDRGRLVRVSLPPQDLTDGVVHLRVQPVILHRLESSDPAALDDRRLHRLLPTLVEGESPDLQAVARNIALVNDNPVRHATLTFKQADAAAATPGQVDVVATPEIAASPWVASLQLNNEGAAAPTHWHLQGVLADANLFDLGHVASFTWTTAPAAVDDLRQYGAFYTLPWYELGATLSAYAFRSTSRTGAAVAGLISVSGSGRFAGLSMKQRLRAAGPWMPAWSLSLDDKRFDNGSAVAGQAAGGIVRSRPLTLGATLDLDTPQVRATLGVQASTNLTGGADNADAAYAAARQDAHADWQVLRLDGKASVRLASGAALVTHASAQFTHDALVTGEQFGLGGPDSIRALEARQFNGDRGWQASAEAWSPEWAAGLRVLAFLDAGRVHEARQGSAPRPGAVAAGLGARWTINSRVSLSTDWAHALSGVGGVPESARRVYVALDARLD